MQLSLFNYSMLIETKIFKRCLFIVKEERLEESDDSPDKADKDTI